MFPHFFIDRPIFSTALALAIALAGLVAMVQLPIAQYPQVTPIQIQVTATYPGANATLVAQNVGATRFCYPPPAHSPSSPASRPTSSGSSRRTSPKGP